MPPSPRRAGRQDLTVNTDLKLMPLMNILIVLIPMLLLSAVFIEMRVDRDERCRRAAPRRR